MNIFTQIDLKDLVGAFDDVAQLSAGEKANLEEMGIHFASARADEAGPVSAAAVQLEDGTQYLLVEHIAHPEQFIDVRARTDAGASRDAAQNFLSAAGVPASYVRWIRERW